MKVYKLIPLLLLAYLAYSCGSSKTAKQEVAEESAPETAEFDEKEEGEQFEEFDEVAETETATEADKESPPVAESQDDPNSFVDDEEEDLFAQKTAGQQSNPQLAQAPKESRQVTKLSADTHTYTVEQGETLMWVAFKIYGDYRMWKSIAKLNKKVLKGKTLVTKNTVLKYKAPEEEFKWKKEGNPFLIRKGDTLGLISKDVYGTQKRWKEIWYNNKPMIINPNIIFAGFTLYYIPDKDKVALN